MWVYVWQFKIMMCGECSIIFVFLPSNKLHIPVAIQTALSANIAARNMTHARMILVSLLNT